MIIGIDANHANKKDRTGVEEYCFQIIQALKNVIPESEQVILYSSSSLKGELANLPPHWKSKILRWPFRKLWTQIRLSMRFIFRKPDVYFSPGQILPCNPPRKTITMVHDSAFLEYPKAYRFWGRQYLKRMNKKIMKKSSLILTSSEFNKKELVKFYGINVGKKTVVIPLSSGTLQVPADFDPKNLGITKPYVLSIGRLETKKNTKQLLHAFTVAKQQSDLQLVLVGKPGVGFKDIYKEIDRNPYKEDIVRMGFVDRTTVAGLLKKATMFVFPSIYEGFGIPVLEAMSIGTPVLAADIEVLHEVGGSAAIYVDPLDTKGFAESMVHVANDQGEQIRYSHEGRERATKFSWAKTAEGTWNAMKSLGAQEQK